MSDFFSNFQRIQRQFDAFEKVRRQFEVFDEAQGQFEAFEKTRRQFRAFEKIRTDVDAVERLRQDMKVIERAQSQIQEHDRLRHDLNARVVEIADLVRTGHQMGLFDHEEEQQTSVTPVKSSRVRLRDWLTSRRHPQARVSVARAPGSFLLRAASFILSPRSRERVVVPMVGDMRDEYFDALQAGDRFRASVVRIRWLVAIAIAVGARIPLAALARWFGIPIAGGG